MIGEKRRRQMLKPSEREKLQDCLLMVQSARTILSGLAAIPAPWMDEIQECFQSADDKLTSLLRS
jgi:hypothetical protein